MVKIVTVTISALGVFIGTLIGVSQATIAQETSNEDYIEVETQDEDPVTEDEIADEDI